MHGETVTFTSCLKVLENCPYLIQQQWLGLQN